jgi:hypothetical protein
VEWCVADRRQPLADIAEYLPFEACERAGLSTYLLISPTR